MTEPNGLSRDCATGLPGPRGLIIHTRGVIWTVFMVAVAAELTVVLLDYVVNFGRLTELKSIRAYCNITREDGIASWVAVTQTMLVAMTLWSIYELTCYNGASRWKSGGWLIMALFFTYMAIDDGTRFHERMGSAFEDMYRNDDGIIGAQTLGGKVVDAFPSYYWQVLFLPFLGAMGLFVLGFLWKEIRRPFHRLLIFAAIGCFVVAVGLDFIEGFNRTHPWNLYTRIRDAYDMDLYRRFGRSAYETLRHFGKSL